MRGGQGQGLAGDCVVLLVERVLLGSEGVGVSGAEGEVDVGLGSDDSESLDSSEVSLELGVVVTVSAGLRATTKVTVRPWRILPSPGVCSRIVPSSSSDSRVVSLIFSLRPKRSLRTSSIFWPV